MSARADPLFPYPLLFRALGRALGVTMAVTFVIGNAFNRSSSIFSPSNSIASALANEFNEAGGIQKSALLELCLILFLITTVVLAFSKLLLLRLAKIGRASCRGRVCQYV